jgi:hypothetical protein
MLNLTTLLLAYGQKEPHLQMTTQYLIGRPEGKVTYRYEEALAPGNGE